MLNKYRGYWYSYNHSRSEACILFEGKQYYIKCNSGSFNEIAKQEINTLIKGFREQNEFENEMLNEHE